MNEVTIIYACDIGWCRRLGTLSSVEIGEFIKRSDVSESQIREVPEFAFQPIKIMIQDSLRLPVWERVS